MTTVDRIFQLIADNNLTAKEFAFMCKLSAGNVTDWKTGRSKPSIEALQKISYAFNINITWLLGESNVKNKESFFGDIKIPSDFKYYVEDLPECIIYQVMCITDSIINLNYDFNKIEEKIGFDLSYKVPLRFRKEAKKAIMHLCDYHIKSAIDTNRFRYYESTIATNVPQLKNETSSHFQQIPIIGKIAAGQPILAEKYIEGYLPVDPNIYGMSTSEDLFYLRISGESMNLKVKNGDYALIKKQDYAEDGDIVAVIVNSDDEATLKRYKKLNDQFVLLEPMSTDLTIESITVDLKTTKFQIIGKAIGQFGKF